MFQNTCIFIYFIYNLLLLTTSSAQNNGPNITETESKIKIFDNLFSLFNGIKHGHEQFQLKNYEKKSGSASKSENGFDDELCGKQLNWFQEKLHQNDLRALQCKKNFVCFNHKIFKGISSVIYLKPSKFFNCFDK